MLFLADGLFLSVNTDGVVGIGSVLSIDVLNGAAAVRQQQETFILCKSAGAKHRYQRNIGYLCIRFAQPSAIQCHHQPASLQRNIHLQIIADDFLNINIRAIIVVVLLNILGAVTNGIQIAFDLLRCEVRHTVIENIQVPFF